jgi:hypothetical protein
MAHSAHGLLQKQPPEVDMEYTLDDEKPLEKIPPPEVLAHNWSYAIAPVDNAVYLTGFCKQCQTVFTAYLKRGIHGLNYTKLDIPLFGCEYKTH